MKSKQDPRMASMGSRLLDRRYEFLTDSFSVITFIFCSFFFGIEKIVSTIAESFVGFTGAVTIVLFILGIALKTIYGHKCGYASEVGSKLMDTALSAIIIITLSVWISAYMTDNQLKEQTIIGPIFATIFIFLREFIEIMSTKRAASKKTELTKG